jgi:hypothetical protein
MSSDGENLKFTEEVAVSGRNFEKDSSLLNE